jgi:cytoskeletal protein RodZ
MRARLMKFGAGVAALAAFALGGSALASAGSGPQTVPPAQAQSATDSGPNVQQGDQSAPDTGSAAEEASSEAPSESSSESAAVNDGPGGYADTVANADTQQTGEH